MPHECGTCGETFETLSEFRLHDCTPAGSVSPNASSSGAWEPSDEPELAELDDRLADARAGEHSALYRFELDEEIES